MDSHDSASWRAVGSLPLSANSPLSLSLSKVYLMVGQLESTSDDPLIRLGCSTPLSLTCPMRNVSDNDHTARGFVTDVYLYGLFLKGGVQPQIPPTVRYVFNCFPPVSCIYVLIAILAVRANSFW